MDEERITAAGLVKQYRGVTAVDDLAFSIEPGGMTGFLGPNGAGETATLRMLLYLVGASAASSVFALLNTYLLQRAWVLTAQVIVPTVASAAMIPSTKTYDQSPSKWAGAAVLLAYGVALGALGITILRRRDVV